MFFLKQLPTREILESYGERFSEMDVDCVEKALTMLRSASTLLRKIEAYFSAHNLSQTRFLILILIDREADRDELTAMHLVNSLDVSKPVVSKTLKAMVEEGLLHTRPHQNDQRSRIFCLAPKGKALLYALLPGYYEILKKHIQSEM